MSKIAAFKRSLPKDEGDIEVGKGSPPWMTTYGDLVTQLLIFFVMMFALAATLNELQLISIKRRIENYAYQNQLGHLIMLDINPKGLVITLSEKMMFDSGQAEIYEDAKAILSAIAGEIIDVPNPVRIEGHTDSVPISTDRFPSNWELSTARATNVARYLVENLEFPPDRIAAGGYSKYHPAVGTEIEDEIFNYKLKVREVPQHYSLELRRASTPEEEDLVMLRIREEQLEIQREMQGIIMEHIRIANLDADRRARNRRVDIIVERIGTTVERRTDIAAPVAVSH